MGRFDPAGTILPKVNKYVTQKGKWEGTIRDKFPKYENVFC